jgi:galactosylceramidase
VGDAEQQALIRQQNDASEGGEKILASANVPGIAAGRWLNLKLRFNGSAITAYVNGQPVLEATDSLYARGMAGLLAGATPKKLSMPYYDNVLVNRVGGTVPAAAAQGLAPLYTENR